jgi:large repetitive protein
LCEAAGPCDAATVTVTITARNDPPLFNDSGPISVVEDGGPVTINGWASGITPGPSNESAQNIGFTVTVDQPALFAALPAIGTNGTLTFTPVADANGMATILVTAVDDGGTSNGGNDRSTPRTAMITITPINDAPTFEDGGDLSVTEDSGPTTINGWATAIRTGPANEALQGLAFTVHIDQPTLFQTLPSIDPSGTITFTPAVNSNGTATITVTTVDDGGTASGGNDTSTTHIAAITIIPVNDPPQFNDIGDITINEDSGPAAITSWAQSIVAGPNDETTQTISFATSADQPSLFSTQPAIDPTGTLIFTPAANENGTATITVTATDDAGSTNGGNDTSVVHTATITVTAVNDPVIATGDAGTVSEDDPVGITIDVLANDTDADGDPLSVISIDTISLAGGTVTNLGNGLINYTADPNFNGTDTFAYTVADGSGSTDAATVMISITPTADAPVATADAFTSSEDTARIVTAPGLIANDYDEDGDNVTITPTPISGPSNGTLTLGTDGAFTYTPTTGFVGTDTFTYQLNDATGLTDIGTVTITVDSGLTTGGLYLGNTSSLATWNMTVAPPASATPEPDHDADSNPGITVTKDTALGTQTWTRNISSNALVLNGPVMLELWSTIEDFQANQDGHPDVTLFDCNNLGLGCVTLGHTDVHIKDYNGGIATWVRMDVSLGNITHTFPVGRQLRLQIQHRHHDLWIATGGTRPSRLNYTLANTSPNATNDTAPAVLEDSGITNIDVLANDADTNLDPGSVTITTPPNSGTATPLLDGTINYQPTPNLDGVDSFTYRVCDTGGLCDTAVVTITITAVNDQPNFSAGADITINATDPPYTHSGWAFGIIPGPANETSQTLTFTITADDPTLFDAQPALSPTGTLTFTPSGSPGTTTITIQLTDNGGTANGGNNTATPQTAQITFV